LFEAFEELHFALRLYLRVKSTPHYIFLFMLIAKHYGLCGLGRRLNEVLQIRYLGKGVSPRCGHIRTPMSGY